MVRSSGSAPRVGLVLGAGGTVGHAFHAGVLSAVAERTGWDAGTADIVVGTSAGSLVGALLRAGLPAPDLAARVLGEPLTPAGDHLLRRVGWTSPSTALSRPRRTPRSLRPSSPRTFLRSLFSPPGSVLPGSLVAAALPAGQVPTIEYIARPLSALFTDIWPRERLWICAVRLADGRRTVFGRDAGRTTDVPHAVAASCAIPGYFTPVTIGGDRYVDGGAHSPTNADVLADRDLALDLVIVSSPMSAVRGSRLALDAAPRGLSRLALGREVRRLRRAGTPVLAFQPTDDDIDVMGVDAMDASRREAVVRRLRDSTAQRLGRADVADRLRILCG